MHKRITAVVAALAVTVGVSACGSSTHEFKPSPTANKELQQAQVKVQKCSSKGFITKSQRQAFMNCIAPKNKQAQVKKCVSKAALNDQLWKKSGRSKFLNDAAECVVQ